MASLPILEAKVCYSNPAKSLQLARSRLTPEQWARFEREFDDFCVVNGLVKPPEHLRHVQRYTHDLLCALFDWAKWAFFQRRQHVEIDCVRDVDAPPITIRFACDHEFATFTKAQWNSLKTADQRVADAKYTRLAIAMMDDEQAQMSLERWMGRGE
jgi:hypothetical protein